MDIRAITRRPGPSTGSLRLHQPAEAGLRGGLIFLLLVLAAFVPGSHAAASQPSGPAAQQSQQSKPKAVSNLTATAVSPNQINLAWRDNSDNETGFEIWMKQGPNGQWARWSTAPANANNWGFGGIAAGTSYGFRVWAVNGAGRSDAYAEAGAATPAIAPVPVPVPVPAQAPSIKVVSPVGSAFEGRQEKWAPGSTQTIRWTYTGDIGPTVQIYMMVWAPKGVRSAGVKSYIATNVKVTPGGSGSYSWLIPPKKEVLESDYQMFVASTAKPNVYGESSFFTITGPLTTVDELVAPAISVASPSEGDRWTTGSTQTIKWTYRGNPPGPDVKIILLTPEKTSIFDFISRKTPIGSGGGGSFTFAIPADWPAGTFNLRIASTANDNFKGDRKIALVRPEAKIVVTSPGRGERWVPGSTQTIRWTYTGDVGPAMNVGLFLGGSAVAVIANDVPRSAAGSGSYRFNVPKGLPATGNYSIRVVSPLRKLTGESAPFAIQ